MRSKIGVLLENRFIADEIQYYADRFTEEGYEVVYLTRLWGHEQLSFTDLEKSKEWMVNQSFEDLKSSDLKKYAAIIMPAGYVSDYLLYEEKPKQKSPAVKFIEKIMKDTNIVKGFICHSLWITGPAQETFAGRKVTCHNNIISHVENTGMKYMNKDVCVDKEIVTARTGGDYKAFVEEILKNIKK